jgi:hypothetical protein
MKQLRTGNICEVGSQKNRLCVYECVLDLSVSE